MKMNTTFRNANSKVYNAVLVPMVEHKRLQSIHETVSLLYKYNRLIDNIEYGRDIYFFLSGFSFTNIHEWKYCTGRRREFL